MVSTRLIVALIVDISWSISSILIRNTKTFRTMTKEEYLELRNSNKFSLDLLWEYYCNKVEEKDRKVKSFDEFVPLYLDYAKIAGFYAIELAQDYFDNKFEVNKLIDTKENKTIRYV